MILSFETIQEKKNTLDSLLPKYPMVTDKNYRWDDIVQAELCDLSHLNHSFKNLSKEELSFLLGESLISFDELKERMIEKSKELYKRGKEESKKDRYEVYKEVEKLKNVKKLVKSLTKKKFDSMFKSNKKYLKLFPSLYRLELSLMDELFPYFYNYLSFNKIEVFDDIVMDSNFDDLLSEFTFDEERSNSLLEIKRRTDRVTENALVLIRSLSDTWTIDNKLLLKNLTKELKS